MTALHELRPGIPITHQEWSNDDYAAEMIMHLGLARAVVSLPDLSPEKQSIIWRGVLTKEEVIQQALANTIIVGLEWAGRNNWPIADGTFSLNLDWGDQGLSHLISRAAGAIAQTQMNAIQKNSSVRESINLAFGYLMDYSRVKKWSLEELVANTVNHKNNGDVLQS